MYQWCELKSRRGRTKNLSAQISNSNTARLKFQRYTCIYNFIYISKWQPQDQFNDFWQQIKQVVIFNSINSKNNLLQNLLTTEHFVSLWYAYNPLVMSKDYCLGSGKRRKIKTCGIQVESESIVRLLQYKTHTQIIALSGY